MSLLPLQKHHYFKCFLKERKTQIEKDCFTGQKIKALGIKVSPRALPPPMLCSTPKAAPHRWWPTARIKAQQHRREMLSSPGDTESNQ